jgi:hypothetical protein
MFAAFGVGQVVWSIVWFTLFFMWIMLLFQVFADIFRSPDLTGLGKAGWTILAILTPYLGVLLYLIVRGGTMHQRHAAALDERDEALRNYVQGVAGVGSAADELARLAELRDRGVIDADDFAVLKAKVLR